VPRRVELWLEEVQRDYQEYERGTRSTKCVPRK
jgi:hypothetical protein